VGLSFGTVKELIKPIVSRAPGENHVGERLNPRYLPVAVLSVRDITYLISTTGHATYVLCGADAFSLLLRTGRYRKATGAVLSASIDG
jgi:hypothetical protein